MREEPSWFLPSLFHGQPIFSFPQAGRQTHILTRQLLPSEKRDQFPGRNRFGTVEKTSGAGKDSENLLRGEALLQHSQIKGSVALGEARPCRIQEKRNVTEVRRQITEQPVQIQLARRGIQKIAAANHLRHPHQSVIHHNGKLIGKDAV